MKLNLKQISLLDASGELTPAQRRQLLDQISQNPEALQQYESTKAAFSLLSLLPFHEPSARDRQRFPAAIKNAIAAALVKPVKQAKRPRMLIRYAMAACLLLGVTAWMWAGDAAQSRREINQMARISSAAVVTAPDKPSAYDLAVTDVEASIRQLQTESPTLSHVYDKNLANLLDALANVPAADEENEEWPGGEPN